MSVTIPMTTKSEPMLSAGWDICEGFIAGLREMHGDDSAALAIEASNAHARAKGLQSNADQTEHDVGRALAKAMQLVLIHNGISTAQWAALAPPGLPGTRTGMMGAVLDFTVGSEGQSGAAGSMGDLAEGLWDATVGGLFGDGEGGQAASDIAADVTGKVGEQLILKALGG